jgi:glucose/arabinose dehydrogenase
MPLGFEAVELSIRKTFCFLAAAVGLTICAPLPAPPPEFERETVADFGNDLVSALEVLPTGHFFVGLRSGRLWVFDPAIGPGAEPFATLPVAFAHEGGVIGAAVCPDFANTRRIYFNYTENRDGERWITVASLAADPADITRAVPGSYRVTFTQQDSLDTEVHFGGGIVFLPDGTLLIGVGDDAQLDTAQNPASMRGKILRLHPDGSIPLDNPRLQGVPTPVYATGLRNPFRLYRDEALDVTYLTDVGAASWEEVNRLYAGANYGWPIVEGRLATSPAAQPPLGYVEPEWAFPHFQGPFELRALSLTDGLVYTGDRYPPELHNRLILVDWTYGTTRFFLATRTPEGIVTDMERWYDEDWGATTDLVQHDGEIYFASARFDSFETPDGWVVRYDRSSISRLRHTGVIIPPLELLGEPAKGIIPLKTTLRVADADAYPEGTRFRWILPDGRSAEGPEFTALVTTTGATVYTAEAILPDGSRREATIPVVGQQATTATLTAEVTTLAGDRVDGAWALVDPVDGEVLTSGAVTAGALASGPRSIPASGAPLLLEIMADGMATWRRHVGAADGVYTLEEDVFLAAQAATGRVTTTLGDAVVGASVTADGTRTVTTDITGLYYLPLAGAEDGELVVGPADAALATVIVPLGVLKPGPATTTRDITVGLRGRARPCLPPPAPDPAPVTWFDVQAIFNRGCVGCHGPVGPARGLVLAEGLSFSRVLDRPAIAAPGLSLIDSRDPASSFLLEKIACGDPQAGNIMPPAGLMSEADRELIARWVLGGQAPDPLPRVTIHPLTTRGRSPLRVRLLGGATFAVEPESLHWDLGNGTIATGHDVEAVYTSVQPEELFTVRLSATDPASGAVYTSEVLLVVNGSVPGSLTGFAVQ